MGVVLWLVPRIQTKSGYYMGCQVCHANGIFVYLLQIYKYDSYLTKYLPYLYTLARYNIVDQGI